MSTNFSVLRIQADLRKEVFRKEILRLAGFKTQVLDKYIYHQEDYDKQSTFQSGLFYCEENEILDEARFLFQIKIKETITDDDLEVKSPLQSMCDPEGGFYVILLFKENNSCLTLDEIKSMYSPVKIVQMPNKNQ